MNDNRERRLGDNAECNIPPAGLLDSTCGSLSVAAPAIFQTEVNRQKEEEVVVEGKVNRGSLLSNSKGSFTSNENESET